MDGLTLLMSVGLPLAMFAGGIAAWRASRRQSIDDDRPGWRDDSLDDWRRERDQRAEAERAARPATPETSTGSEEQRETTTRHQRIGG